MLSPVKTAGILSEIGSVFRKDAAVASGPAKQKGAKRRSSIVVARVGRSFGPAFGDPFVGDQAGARIEPPARFPQRPNSLHLG